MYTHKTGSDSVPPPQSRGVGKSTLGLQLWYSHPTEPTFYHQWLFLPILKAFEKHFPLSAHFFFHSLSQVYILGSKAA